MAKVAIGPDIDKSEIPIGMLSEDWFIKFESNFRTFLTDAKNQRAICVHEGAHSVFLVRSGGQDIKLSGPRLFLRNNKLVAHSATVKANSIDRQYLDTFSVSQSISAAAQAFAAGCAAVEELLELEYSGASDDFDLFQLWYDPTRTKYNLPETGETTWPKVKESVKQTLRKQPQIKQAILAEADRFHEILFS